MAKLRVYQSIENDVWVINLVNDPDALSETDKSLMAKFGEPEINIGGTFLGSTADEFTLPDSYVKVRSDFPVRQEFDSTSAPFSTNTSTKVLAWRDAIVASFTAAFVTLRANTDTFTKEVVYDSI